MNCYFVNWQSFREFRVRETAPPLQDWSPLMVRVLLNRFRSLARKIRNFGAPGKEPRRNRSHDRRQPQRIDFFVSEMIFEFDRVRDYSTLISIFGSDKFFLELFRSEMESDRKIIENVSDFRLVGRKKVSVGFRNSAERVFELRYPPIWWII